MKQKSPELEIPEGIFYDGIPNCNLYVQKKDMNTGKLYGIMIYRMTDSYEDAAIILADETRHAMFIVTLLEACLTFVRRRCFRALYGAGVGRFRRRPRAPAPDTAPQTTPTPALPVIIHKHYVIGPETPGDATPRPPEQSGAQRTIFAAPQSETLSAWERLADDDEPFDDGEPLDDLPDDVTEQERAEIERFDLNRYR
jgi:hypothetical protein